MTQAPKNSLNPDSSSNPEPGSPSSSPASDPSSSLSMAKGELGKKPPRRWIGRFFRTFLILAAVMAGAAGAGSWWMWRYVQSDLTPLVEKQVGKILKRPVDIGEIEQIGPFGIRFGASEIPTTATDSDRATTQAVDVRFNPLQLLWTGGTLDLNVTLVDPDIYLEQNKAGEWASTDLNLAPSDGPLKIGLKTLKLRRGNVRAVPFWQGKNSQAAAVDLQDVTGKLNVGAAGQPLKFEVDGQVVGQTGRVNAQGEIELPPLPNEKSPAPKAPAKNPRISLEVKGKDLLIADMKRVLEKTVPFPVVALGEGRIDADLDLSFVPGDPNVSISGDAVFRGVTAKVPQLPLPVKNAQGKVTIKDKDIRVVNATGNYGALELETQGQIHLVNGLNLTAKLKPLEVNRALETAAVKLPVPVAGMATAENLRVTGKADSPIITGTVRAGQQARAAQVLTVDQVPFKEASSQFEFKDSVIKLSEIRAVPNSGGLVSGSGAIDLNPGGGITIKTSATGLNGDELVKLYNDGELGLKLGSITAQTQTTGPVDRPKTTVRFQAPQGDYPALGVAQIADGVVTVDDLVLNVKGGTVRGVGKLQGDRWSGTANLSGVRLNQFSSELRGKLSGNVALGGPVKGFSPKTLEAKGTLTFDQGIAIVEDPLTAQIQWDGARSQVVVASATAPGIRASGTLQTNIAENVTDPPDITALNLKVTARDYDLKNFPLDAKDAPVAFNLGGLADFDGTLVGALDAVKAQGDLRIRQFNLNDLPFDSFLTGKVTYGPTGVNLNLAGDRDAIALNLDADLKPRDLLFKQNGQAIAQVNRTATDQYTAQLNQFNLAALNIRPNTGLGDVPLEGLASGNATVNLKTPLTASGSLSVTRPALGKLKGTELSGKFNLVNGLARLTDTVLVQDLCRRQQGDRCIDPVQTRYVIEKGELSLGQDPKFDVAIAVQNGDTQGLLRMVQWFDFRDIQQGLKGAVYGSATELEVTGLGLPDSPLFTQLQRFSEIKQLVAQQAAEERQAARYPALSDLKGQFTGRIAAQGSLKGALNSTFDIAGQDWAWGRYDLDSVSVKGEFADGLLTLLPIRVTDGDAVVSFQGQLGQQKGQQKGQPQGQQQQSGQLRAERVPVSLARNFIDLPVDLAGELDLQATLAGTTDNPQAIGSLNLTNGKLNGTAVETEKVGFNYVNARLGFGGSLGIAALPGTQSPDPEPKNPEPKNPEPKNPEPKNPEPKPNNLQPSSPNPAEPQTPFEPVRISGSIPYQLPFSKVKPDNDKLALNLNVKNEGLAFLNLLSQDQVQWRGGEGQIQLNVGGTLKEPIATGQAVFRDAVLAAQVLPDELLTKVNGEIQFNRDRIRVKRVEGLFSKGLVVAEGSIPIAKLLPNDPTETPLNVNFRELKLNLRGLYRGGADGTLVINGTALRPELAGQIMLKQGQVLLSEPSTAGTQTAAAPAEDSITIGSGSIATRVPVFDNLNLSLGEDVRIAFEPIFSFFAQGGLALTGDLNNPLLDGEIKLTRGKVNLFTTSFNLARKSRNVAIFSPEQGLNPNLQLELVTAVTEVSRSRSLFETTSTSEISDQANAGDFGSLQTVRVRARVDGPASTLLDNITLASSPNRSQGEILSLIGGGFVDTLGRGGDGTLALANLAGSALLGNLQTAINNTLSGPVEVRIFPAVVESTDRRNQAESTDGRSSVLALGGEVGVNINNNLSFSALKLLTVDLPAQFNLRYQLNDNLTLRATTDLQGESRAVVEYEKRF